MSLFIPFQNVEYHLTLLFILIFLPNVKTVLFKLNNIVQKQKTFQTCKWLL